MVKAGGTLERGSWGYDSIKPYALLAAAIRMAKDRLRNAAAPTADGVAPLARASSKQACNIFGSARKALAIAATGFINTLNLPLYRPGGRRVWGLGFALAPSISTNQIQFVG
jgi:glucokinase